MRAVVTVASVIALGLAAAVPLRSQDARPGATPRAIVVEYDGIIHPIAAEVIDRAITRADSTGAAVTVIELRTPGGLLDSTRTIVSRMMAARAPVVVFVGGGVPGCSCSLVLGVAVLSVRLH